MAKKKTLPEPVKATTYNGWTNYETWVVKLWMDNSEGDQEFWSDQVYEARQHPIANQYMTINRRIVHTLVERLRAAHDGAAEEWMSDQASVFADMVNAGLAAVNWYEIAESLLEGHPQEANEEAL